MNDHDVHKPVEPTDVPATPERPGPSGLGPREPDPAPAHEGHGRSEEVPAGTPDEIAQDTTVDRVQTPEAVEAAKIARTRLPGRPLDPHVRARGVEWVRPTDLMARQGAQLAGRGIDFQSAMALRARQKAVAGVRSLSERAKRLPPLSAFGRGAMQHGPSRSAVGAS